MKNTHIHMQKGQTDFPPSCILVIIQFMLLVLGDKSKAQKSFVSRMCSVGVFFKGQGCR